MTKAARQRRQQRNRRYCVHASDQRNITLTLTPIPIMGAVIPRSSIAGVSERPGLIRVETKGGQVYEIYPGLRRKQVEKTHKAFGDLAPNTGARLARIEDKDAPAPRGDVEPDPSAPQPMAGRQNGPTRSERDGK